jgi:hypothetical protein
MTLRRVISMLAALTLAGVGAYVLFWEFQILASGGRVSIMAVVAAGFPFGLGLLWFYSEIRGR